LPQSEALQPTQVSTVSRRVYSSLAVKGLRTSYKYFKVSNRKGFQQVLF